MNKNYRGKLESTPVRLKPNTKPGSILFEDRLKYGKWGSDLDFLAACAAHEDYVPFSKWSNSLQQKYRDAQEQEQRELTYKDRFAAFANI